MTLILGNLKGEITDLLLTWRQGDPQALERLLPRVYDQLKHLAARLLRYRNQDQTLQTTALVHETYLRLVELDRVNWQDRAQFFAISSRLIRRILIDHARQESRAKRGGGEVKFSLDEALDQPAKRPRELLELDDALRDLESQRPVLAEVVMLRYFGGLSRDEIAEVLGIGSATVTRRWRAARAWLLRQLDLRESANGESQHGGRV